MSDARWLLLGVVFIVQVVGGLVAWSGPRRGRFTNDDTEEVVAAIDKYLTESRHWWWIFAPTGIRIDWLPEDDSPSVFVKRGSLTVFAWLGVSDADFGQRLREAGIITKDPEWWRLGRPKRRCPVAHDLSASDLLDQALVIHHAFGLPEGGLLEWRVEVPD